MLHISNVSVTRDLYGKNREIRFEAEPENISLLDKDGGIDSVNFSGNNNQSWQDIANEWREYTSSIWGKPEPEFNSREEREQYWITYYDKYIEFCDRVLNCSDLPDEERTEWQRMKDYAARDRNYHFRDLNNWKKDNNIATESYKNSYTQLKDIEISSLSTLAEKSSILSLIDRMLSCDNVPEDIRTEYQEKYMQLLTDINRQKVSEDYDNANGITFEMVYNEFDFEVPDSTTTITEKELAISYIDRMLACEDITPELKTYWSNKKMVIEMEIQSLRNSESEKNTEKIADVWEEFKEYTDKYFDSINDDMTMEEKYENRVAYYNMYKSFLYRLMNCSDITEELKAEYNRMEYNADFDIMNWERDYQRYRNSQ